MYDHEKMKTTGGDLNYSYEAYPFHLRVGLRSLFYISNSLCSMDGIISTSHFIETKLYVLTNQYFRIN